MLQLQSDIRLKSDPILRSLSALEDYIIRERYRGYDPYDTLASPLFQGPLLKSNRAARFAAQQVVRRMPANIRPILGISPGYNPVTLGLCLQGFSYMSSLFPEKSQMYRREIEFCLNELEQLQSTGFSGACWGYDFDWETRYTSIPAFTPTIVATGVITHALFEYYSLFGDSRAFEICKSATRFVMNDLRKQYDGDTFCYSYAPRDNQQVFNATMMGARLLAEVYSVTHDPALFDEARRTVEFVSKRQQASGAWPYAVGDARTWTDNFHTGYVLDCLNAYRHHTDDTRFGDCLSSGVEYYASYFVDSSGAPKYFADSLYPVDSTAAAQTILTLARFGYRQDAHRVGQWMIAHMQDSLGFFYYRKHRWYIDRTPYMRWSNAWMYVALASLLMDGHDLV